MWSTARSRNTLWDQNRQRGSFWVSSPTSLQKESSLAPLKIWSPRWSSLASLHSKGSSLASLQKGSSEGSPLVSLQKLKKDPRKDPRKDTQKDPQKDSRKDSCWLDCILLDRTWSQSKVIVESRIKRVWTMVEKNQEGRFLVTTCLFVWPFSRCSLIGCRSKIWVKMLSLCYWV